jgi:hypothetical protein
MPLRDHFRPPVDDAHSWEELHGQWPGTIVQYLRKTLPAGYEAGPGVHHRADMEIDVATFEKDEPTEPFESSDSAGGVATAVWAPPQPSVAVRTRLSEYDEYEVRVYDARRRRQLVAAIEIVSPANKDRPESRNVFVGKCAALLQKGVAVCIVDLVTVRHFNLYADLMALIGHEDPTLGDEPSHVYATASRWVEKGKKGILQSWSNVLTIGQPLPTLPLWLSETLVVPLDLEQSYEQACHDLWIT